MASQKIWYSINEIFIALNNAGCNYVVMRNYECFESGQVFINGHDDIDILCDDIKLVQKTLDTKRRFIFPTINSYYIQLNQLRVYVDIRYVGDGYYDTTWQLNMLKNRIITQQHIFVMEPIDYFYSLVYHAIFHKNYLSTDYLNKLPALALNIGKQCSTQEEFLSELALYMSEQQYKITITRDPGVILNFADINVRDIQPRYFWLLKRKVLNQLKRCRMIGDKYV